MNISQFNDKDIQTIIGNVLRYGVWIALTVSIIGGVILLFQDGNSTIDFRIFTENDRNIFKVLHYIIAGVFQFNGEAIVFLGIILLFLTPILRILLSLISFLIEKDYLYVGITLIVVLIIISSLALGFSH